MSTNSRQPDAQPPAQPPAQGQAPAAEKAARRRADAMDGVKPEDRNMVDALLAERRGYQQRGMDDRVAQVDEQLQLRGYRSR